MEYRDLLVEWRKRRDKIRADYQTGQYSIRDLAAKYKVSDSRILVIVHAAEKSAE